MSEELLKALLQLFALASSKEDLTSESREVVHRYLINELGSEQADVQIEYYDKFVKKHLSGSESGSDRENVVKEVCTTANSNLVQPQKITILLRLLEYIMADENISDHEHRFLEQVVAHFNIPENEFQDAVKFSAAEKNKTDYSPNFLIVDEEKPDDQDEGKFKKVKHLNGRMLVLYIESTNTYAFRYFGKESLFLNGQSIVPGLIYLFTNGSAVRGNLISPIYYSDVTSMFMKGVAGQEILFEAAGIEYTFPNGDNGLHRFDLKEKSGKMLGIMGGSGAGKSTLLNVLNGNLTPSKGAVRINGIDVHRENQKLKGVVGYVSQDDLLIEDLTVFQNLYYNAKLCFDDLSYNEVKEKVKSLLDSLGLREAKDLKVGSPVDKVISGGQRKRLNIALELIREPSVLFVDEPTSGLSSRDSENIMDLLKQLALKGKLIFVVIHQPSSDIFKLFDKLIMLDLGGYPVYYGDPVESIIYFKDQTNQVNSEESECPECGNVNPEQVFNMLETKVINEYGDITNKRKITPESWNKRYLKYNDQNSGENEKAEDYEKPESDLKKPGVFKQFSIFLKRDVLSKLANRQYMMINLLEAPVLALILSFFVKYSANPKGENYTYALLDNENLPAYIFMAVIVALFIGLTVSAEEIIKDRKIRKRETFLDLSKGSYLMSKIMILLGLSGLQMLLFVVIGNWMMEIEGMNFYYWFTLFTTATFANMLGLNISSAFNSAITIYILIPFLIIPQLIFSGVIVKFDKLNPSVSARSHVPFIGEVMASRWAFEGLTVAQFMYNDLGEEMYKYNKRLSALDYRRSYWMPEIESRLNLLETKAGVEKEEADDQVKAAVKLIQNELNTPDQQLNYPTFDFEWKYGNEEYNENIIADAEVYLKRLKKGLNKHFNRTMAQKDGKIAEIEGRSEESGYYNKLKNRHLNTGLEDMVTNKSELERIIEIDGTLFQQQNPIYYDAQEFRAHFYSPNKLLFGHKIPTFIFNNGVIWVMSLILAVTLYFDVFRKFLSLFNFKFKLRLFRSR